MMRRLPRATLDKKGLDFTVTRTGNTDGIAALVWYTRDLTTDRNNDYDQKSGYINFKGRDDKDYHDICKMVILDWKVMRC